MFAGADEASETLVRYLQRRGARVTAIDTRLGGQAHDVLYGNLGHELEMRIRALEFDGVFLAPPCSSYSVRRWPRLRSFAKPDGVEPTPPEWSAYLRKHNLLTALSARLFGAACEAGVPVGLENPSDRSDRSSFAFWARFADHGAIWRTSSLAPVLRRFGARIVTFAQCSLGSLAQKWTSIACGGALIASLAHLGTARFRCQHGAAQHPERLQGYDELGRSRTERSAAYPPPMCAEVGEALIVAALRPTAASPTPAPDDLGTDSHFHPSEGRIASGPEMGPVARAACEVARSRPIGFSSPRSLFPSTPAELRTEPFPGDLHAPVTSTRPKGSCKARRRRPLHRAHADGGRAQACSDEVPLASVSSPAPSPSTVGAAQLDSHYDSLVAELLVQGMPLGAIDIASLFLDDTYETQVLSWLRLADAAAAAIRRGETPPEVPTRMLEQSDLQPWARGVVFDCRDPAACFPVRRSTRHTTFPGARQLDRAAVRRIAEEMDWHDTDIIDQIGEGGVEVRSDCEQVIVLAFHHHSLLQEVDAAGRSVVSGQQEGWVAPLQRHLPFVPCRLQPRGVVLQSRVRVGTDGNVEEYLKPRITTDSSFGGPDSVNAGVSDFDRSVSLPSIQQLARGWAICDSAYADQPATDGGDTQTRGYCIDAESAYSFCPIQEADLWTQGFIWWGADGRAGFTYDRRMGFGGAFAPNRFERVSTFVAAYAQHLQAEFDSAHPPPACAARWTADRRTLQVQSDLPPGEAQVHPRYLQVFIDDFTGAAGDDSVSPPPSVAHIVFDADAIASVGCQPAAPGTRVYVHAQLVVLALATLGLHAAPQKSVVGSPLIALGFRLDGDRQVLDCPPTKRRAILADAAAQREQGERGTVDRQPASRLVGRLCNLSQCAPALRPLLHGGYAVTAVSWVAGGRRRALPRLSLAQGGAAQLDWLQLLDAATDIFEANEGVAFAPRLVAPGRHEVGSATFVTDASGGDGDDGFGGYAFVAGLPTTVFVMSELWPDWARLALAASADPVEAERRRRDATRAAPMLGVPAAELFTAVVLPRAVARVTAVRLVYSVVDCEPASHALVSQYSPNPQMRVLTDAARGCGLGWLAAQVMRDANQDADRLSHPPLLPAVCLEAESAGLRVVMVTPDETDWDLLRDAISISTSGRPRRRKRRRGQATARA